MIPERAAMIEIVERRKKPAQDSLSASVCAPNEVRINGQRVAIPTGYPITVEEIDPGNSVALVTLTLFARRLFIGHEHVDEEVTDRVAAATKALQSAYEQSAAVARESATAIEDAQKALEAAHRDMAEATEEKPSVKERLDNLSLLPKVDGEASDG